VDELVLLLVGLRVVVTVVLRVAQTEGLLLGVFVCEGVPLLLLDWEGVPERVLLTVFVTDGVTEGVPELLRVTEGETVADGDHVEPSGSNGGSDGHGVPCGAADAAAVAPPPPSVITQFRPKGPATAVSASITINSVAGSGADSITALARHASTAFVVVPGAQ
jgi:hypothetical protein